MTDRAEIERLLNQTGRTLESVTKVEIGYGSRRNGKTASIIKHQSDVIELLVGALQDSEPKRKYGECYHCKNGTYSCPITQMDKMLIRYSNFCDECGRDLRAVVAGYWRKKDE